MAIRLTKYILLFFLFVFFIPLVSHISYASESGSLQGRLIDSETGEVLQGATVQIQSVRKGSYSDVKGEYKIKDIVPGVYNLRISHVGYQLKEIPNIEVKPGKPTVVDILLIPQVSQTGEIVVSGNRTYDNQAAVLTQRKNSQQVSDGISAEEIKKLPDSDAGQSLRRVSGVTLVDNKYIFVRGISSRYSSTTLNGTAVSSTEPDKKSFAYDMLPSSLLESASIVKSFTPDLPGNFAGGLVQLRTVDFPDGFSIKAGFGTAINDNLTFQNKFYSYKGGKTDWLGFDDGSRSLPEGFPGSPMEMKQLTADLRSSDEAVLINAQNKWLALSRAFNDNSWKSETGKAMPDGNFNLLYTDLFSMGDNDFSIISSLNYSNVYEYNAIERGALLSDGAQYNYQGKGSQSTFSTNLGAMLNLAYKIGTTTSLSLKNIYDNSSDDQTTYIEGFREQSHIKQYGFDYVQKSLLSSQVSGEHKLPFSNSSILWNLGYSKSERYEPDFRRVRYSTNDTTQPYKADINKNNGNGSMAGRYFSDLDDKAFSGSIDYSFNPFENIKIKLGGLFENKNREFVIRSLTITQSSYLLPQYFDPDFGYAVPNSTDEQLEDRTFSQDPGVIFNSANFGYNKLGISEETKPTDSYKANESLYSGYIMGDFMLYIGENKLRLIGGVRMENSRQKLYSYYPISSLNSDSTFVDKSYLDFLPALSLVFGLNNDMNLRLSVSQTLTRPSLREYAPFSFYDFQFQSDVVGNANLKRTLIQNYDLRWEYFRTPDEVLSAGIFYKNFENAIEETIIGTASNPIRTFDNSKGTATNYGIELEAKKNLSFLSDWLSNISLNMNLAFIKSNVTVSQGNVTDSRPMWGQSPYTFNLGLFYSNPDTETNINLGFNVYGKRIIQVGDITKYSFDDPHVYEMPRKVVDVSLSQALGSFEVKLVAHDILHEKLIWQQGGKTVASDYKGRTFSLGFSYKTK